MVQNICRDITFLSRKAERATKQDIQIGKDLQDTLAAQRGRCAGMAANMIGVNKSIIVVDLGFVNAVMFNPVIISETGPYEAEEGCLSLSGKRPVVRYENIIVEYQDFAWEKQRLWLTGFIAQIVQHEVDHTLGIVI